MDAPVLLDVAQHLTHNLSFFAAHAGEMSQPVRHELRAMFKAFSEKSPLSSADKILNGGLLAASGILIVASAATFNYNAVAGCAISIVGQCHSLAKAGEQVPEEPALIVANNNDAPDPAPLLPEGPLRTTPEGAAIQQKFAALEARL